MLSLTPQKKPKDLESVCVQLMITEYSSAATRCCPACLASYMDSFLATCLDGPGWGQSSVGGPCISVGFRFSGAELASLGHLTSCNSSAWIGGGGSSHRAVGLKELDSYSISWDWCPGGSLSM